MINWILISTVLALIVGFSFSLYNLASVLAQGSPERTERSERNDRVEKTDKPGKKWQLPFFASVLTLTSAIVLTIFLKPVLAEPVQDNNQAVLTEILELRHDVELLKEFLKIHLEDHHREPESEEKTEPQ
ncbi:MAG: hypothetical protein FWG12_01600 [Holophagaceae bacterium]|nr:hypothetical protein [Holophagaceae bacterium]